MLLLRAPVFVAPADGTRMVAAKHLLFLPAVGVCVVACVAQLLLRSSTYPDRLGQIAETSTVIDNVKPYAMEADWSTTGAQAMLHQITPFRAAFFDGLLADHVGRQVSILDAGCGGGLVSLALARLGHNVTGVDASEAGVSHATKAAVAGGLQNARFEVGSIYSLQYPPASFDAVVCADVLEHLTDLPAALRELRRVLRPGGILLMDTINRSLLSYLILIFAGEMVLGTLPRGAHDWRLFITPDELDRGLEAAGFQRRNQSFPGFRPSIGMMFDMVRAYLLHNLPVQEVRAECELEGDPGWANYFASAIA